jgi:hypothetical protein
MNALKLPKFRVSLLIAACILCAIIRSTFSDEFSRARIGTTPDSEGYQLLAVNWLRGAGYHQAVIDDVEYDAFTQSLMRSAPRGRPERPSCNRPPGYPGFLAAVYGVHGVNPDWIYFYQRCMAMAAAGLLPLCGFLVVGLPGLAMGVLAAIALSLNVDSAYPVSLLLTECLTEFLLVISLVVALLSRRRTARWAILTAIILAAATLTRPGVVCIAGIYALLLLVRDRRKCAVFVIAFAASILPWSLWASVASGHAVLLSGNSNSVIVAGIDPVRAAHDRHSDPPELTEDSLRDFWRNWPGLPNASVSDYVLGVPAHAGQFVNVQKFKFKIAVHSLPVGPFTLACLAAALTFLVARARYRADSPGARASFGGYELRLVAGLSCVAVATLLIDSAYVQLLLLAGVLVSSIPTSARSDAASAVPRRDGPLDDGMIASFIVGYILMVMISIGNPRFIRPVLPGFYLAAALALPLLVAATRRLSRNGERVQEKERIPYAPHPGPLPEGEGEARETMDP